MKLRITVEGVAYEVDVEVLDETGEVAASLPTAASIPASRPAPPASAPSRPAPAAAPAPAASGDKLVKAPIAGTVVAIKVNVGDQINKDQVLLVMEAMKMETNIASPSAGKVKSIAVAPGAAVKTGQLLVEFE